MDKKQDKDRAWIVNRVWGNVSKYEMDVYEPRVDLALLAVPHEYKDILLDLSNTKDVAETAKRFKITPKTVHLRVEYAVRNLRHDTRHPLWLGDIVSWRILNKRDLQMDSNHRENFEAHERGWTRFVPCFYNGTP